MDIDERQAKFLKAKLGFQSEIESIERSSTVDFTNKEGRRKKYDYVDLAAVFDYALPRLSKHGLVLSSQSVYRDIFNERKNGETVERVFVRSVFGISATLSEAETGYSETETVWHEHGELRDIKDRGALITYLRRYAVMNLLGLAAKGEDDDGGAGGQRKDEQKPPGNKAETKPPAKTQGAKSNAQIKVDFEAIGLTEAEMVSLRMAKIDTMDAAVSLYERFGKDKAKMMKHVNGEGEQAANE